jgi:hypothetical protein
MTSDQTSILFNILSVVISVVVTWLASKYYYKKSGDELKSEAVRLRNIINSLAQSMEKAKLIEAHRNADGDITSLTISSGSVTLPSLQASGKGTTTPTDGEPS